MYATEIGPKGNWSKLTGPLIQQCKYQERAFLKENFKKVKKAMEISIFDVVRGPDYKKRAGLVKQTGWIQNKRNQPEQLGQPAAYNQALTLRSHVICSTKQNRAVFKVNTMLEMTANILVIEGWKEFRTAHKNRFIKQNNAGIDKQLLYLTIYIIQP